MKINKKTLHLNDTLDLTNLAVYRTFHPIAAEYTLFSSALGTLSRIDCMLGNKTSLNTLKENEIGQASFLTTVI